MKPEVLAEKVFERFQTRDVLRLAEISRLKILYERWFPVTLGEFDWRTKTIRVNENAGIETKKIIAHELGHYFLREFNIKGITDEEKFCDGFAESLVNNE
jgi:hypothetical protein